MKTRHHTGKKSSKTKSDMDVHAVNTGTDFVTSSDSNYTDSTGFDVHKMSDSYRILERFHSGERIQIFADSVAGFTGYE